MTKFDQRKHVYAIAAKGRLILKAITTGDRDMIIAAATDISILARKIAEANDE